MYLCDYLPVCFLLSITRGTHLITLNEIFRICWYGMPWPIVCSLKVSSSRQPSHPCPLVSFPLPLSKPVHRFVIRLKKRLHKGWRRLRTLAQGLFPSSSSKSCPSSGTGYGKASGELWVNGKVMQSIPVAEVHTPEELMRYVKQVNTHCCPGQAQPTLAVETKDPH